MSNSTFVVEFTQEEYGWAVTRLQASIDAAKAELREVQDSEWTDGDEKRETVRMYQDNVNRGISTLNKLMGSKVVNRRT